MTKLEIIADGRKIRPINNISTLWIRYDSIYEAYHKPGITKIQIWKQIEENAKRIDATVGISSKNSFGFTCVGFFLDEANAPVRFKLTRDYCYIAYN